MGLAPVFAAALTGLLLAAISAVLGRRVVHTKESERLDRDALASRVAWSGDVIVLSGVALTSLSSALIKYRADDELSAVTWIALIAAFASGILAATLMTHHQSKFINRYPESLYDDVWRGKLASPKKWAWLTPGVLVAIFFGVALALSSLVAAELREDNEPAPAMPVPSTSSPKPDASPSGGERP